MRRFIGGLTAFVAAVLVAGGAFAQELPKPGKEHQELAKAVGKWKLTVKEGFNAGQTGTSEFKTVRFRGRLDGARQDNGDDRKRAGANRPAGRIQVRHEVSL
jgi:hypothetical protein